MAVMHRRSFYFPLKTKYLKKYVHFGGRSPHGSLCLFLSGSLDKDGTAVVVSVNPRFSRAVSGWPRPVRVSAEFFGNIGKGRVTKPVNRFCLGVFLRKTPLGDREDSPG